MVLMIVPEITHKKLLQKNYSANIGYCSVKKVISELNFSGEKDSYAIP